MEFNSIDSSDDDNSSLQHLVKSNIMKMNNNDDYFDEGEDDNVEILLVLLLSLFTRKPNESINSMLGLVMSRDYKMRICLQGHIKCHLKPMEHFRNCCMEIFPMIIQNMATQPGRSPYLQKSLLQLDFAGLLGAHKLT
jgi:hypothetical protein